MLLFFCYSSCIYVSSCASFWLPPLFELYLQVKCAEARISPEVEYRHNSDGDYNNNDDDGRLCIVSWWFLFWPLGNMIRTSTLYLKGIPVVYRNGVLNSKLGINRRSSLAKLADCLLLSYSYVLRISLKFFLRIPHSLVLIRLWLATASRWLPRAQSVLHIPSLATKLLWCIHLLIRKYCEFWFKQITSEQSFFPFAFCVLARYPSSVISLVGLLLMLINRSGSFTCLCFVSLLESASKFFSRMPILLSALLLCQLPPHCPHWHYFTYNPIAAKPEM